MRKEGRICVNTVEETRGLQRLSCEAGSGQVINITNIDVIFVLWLANISTLEA